MSLDRLTRVLDRALRRAALTKKAAQRLKAKSHAQAISEDFAGRLAERGHYRGLLSEERLDGLRFRWYFTEVQKDIPLDQLRAWIDARIASTV